MYTKKSRLHIYHLDCEHCRYYECNQDCEKCPNFDGNDEETGMRICNCEEKIIAKFAGSSCPCFKENWD